MFYYALANLRPVYRSTLKSIHLLAVVYYYHICKYEIDTILEPIVNAVKKLEQVSAIVVILKLNLSFTSIYGYICETYLCALM